MSAEPENLSPTKKTNIRMPIQDHDDIKADAAHAGVPMGTLLLSLIRVGRVYFGGSEGLDEAHWRVDKNFHDKRAVKVLNTLHELSEFLGLSEIVTAKPAQLQQIEKELKTALKYIERMKDRA